MNTLTRALADLCVEQLLDEKWLIAPSRRVGHQWLETITRSGQSAVNARVKTLKSMAIDLAAPAMAKAGVTLVSPRAGMLLVDRALRELSDRELRYLTSVETTSRLAETAYASIDAVRTSAGGSGFCLLPPRPSPFWSSI